MNIFYNILAPLSCLLFGYIFGSIPTAVIIGKVFYHQDPRNYGSHNSGGTNAGRLWGKKVGLLIIIIDMIKTIAPLWVCWAIFRYVTVDGLSLAPTVEDMNAAGFNSSHIIPWPVYFMAPLGCILGHCWPIFAGFKGGKGVSCFMGTTVTTSWAFGFLPGFVYLAVLKSTKYVSLSGIVSSIVTMITSWIWAILQLYEVIPVKYCWIPMYGPNIAPGWIYATLVTIMGLLMIVRHKENIARIKAGTERKITWM